MGPMANGPNFMFPTRSESKDDYGFHSTRYLQLTIEAHAQWIKEFLGLGWDGYLFTVMFHNLPGSRDAKVTQMKQEVTQLYGRLATRMVRKPRSPRWGGYLPVGLFIPDLPVPKSRKGKKSTIADVSINDGLHMHGIVLGNKWGRMRRGLDEHFEADMGQYLTNKVRNIHVAPITHNPGYVVEYALKGLVKRTAFPDDVLLLNWGRSVRKPDFLRETMRKFLGRDRNIWMYRNDGCISTLPLHSCMQGDSSSLDGI